MQIRQITESELTDLLEIYRHLHHTDAPIPEREVLERTWSRIIGNPDIAYFGVFLDKAMVSTCALGIIPNLTRGCRPYGVIENVVTHSAHRCRGFGRSVLEHALEYAWSKGCYKVMLPTGSKKEETLRFYESAGFDGHAKQAFLAKPADVKIKPHG